MNLYVTSLINIDTVPQYALGDIYEGASGVYVYVKGVASTVAGDLLVFNKVNFVTTRSLNDAVGSVGIAQGSLVANTFGWVQVAGSAIVKSGTVIAGLPAYLTTTAGQIDDAFVVGDIIYNMFTVSANAAAPASSTLPAAPAGMCYVSLTNPFVTNT